MSNTNSISNLECNDSLANMLKDLRVAQKAYFKAKAGTAEKFEALRLSKALEKDLDEFLDARLKAQAQPKLF